MIILLRFNSNLRFYRDDGLQEHHELVVRTLQLATAMCNDSCSGTAGEPQRYETVGENCTFFTICLTDRSNIDMQMMFKGVSTSIYGEPWLWK